MSRDYVLGVVSDRLPEKKDVALALLESSSVLVHLDPRKEDVRVPSWFKKQPQLLLQFGLNLPVPIRDLEVDDEAVSGTLSFSRQPHYCYIPWSAVYAMVDETGRGMMWPEDVPPEVTIQASAAPPEKKKRPALRAVPDASEVTDEATLPEVPTSKASKPPFLREVPTEPEREPEPDQEKPAAGKRQLPPYLRVVK